MATATSEGVPGARHQLTDRLRAAVLGPRGGGTTRRRASDAFRLGLAVVVVAVSIPVMRANSAAELSIVRAVHPPPAAISWLVTLVFWLGSAGVSVLLVVVGLLVPRLTAVRRAAVAAVLTWVVCILLGALLGPAAGRPPVSELAGLNVGYPVTQIAVAIAVAATALPYLSRPVHRLVRFLVAVAVLAAVCGGEALPVNAISSVALGWGVAAGLHLAVGSPLGLPSAAEVTEWIADLHVAVADIARAPRQVWGVEQFTGRDPAGEAIELSVYGRDASDAGVLAKLWRFCVYRDSGATLIMDRLQQVEHEAYLTLMAERAGVLVPDVLAAGGSGPAAMQRSALDPGTVAALKDHKDLLPRLREAVADGAGIEVPKLAEVKRVSWANLLFAVGSLIGIWAIIGVLSGAGDSLEAIKGASWGWVALTFVFAELPVVAEGWALLGAATGQLPFGRCVALETSNTFTALVGGDVAVFAVRVRFFQRQGYDAAAAVSAGAIATTAGWTVKGLLFLVAIPFAAGSFQAPSGSGGHQTAVWVILAVILAAGVAAALIALVPRLRRLASRRIRPHLLNIWANVKTIATEPRKIVYVLVGSTLAQLLVILALGTSLHAVGQHASIATLITVNTFAGLIGGAVPIPGGLGVVEAGLIAGLAAAGIPQDQAVAAVLIQRFFTSYLPPVWGWATLAWMRRREYV